MDSYRDYLAHAGIRMSNEDWAIYEPRIIRQEFKKNDIIIKQGQTENFLSIVTSGIARFFIEKEDKDVTLNFIFENNYLSSYESFLTRTPSPYTIEALTDLVLWRSSHESFLYFF